LAKLEAKESGTFFLKMVLFADNKDLVEYQWGPQNTRGIETRYFEHI